MNPFNVVGVCRPHHDELTNEAAWGYETGLLLHSWDAEPSTPAPCLSGSQQAALWAVHTTGWMPRSPYEVDRWLNAGGTHG